MSYAIRDLYVVILNLSNAEGILTGDATLGETLLLDSGCVAKVEVEEANRGGNQLLNVSSVGMGS